MKIKKDDKVIVITGKDRGKEGKVLRAFHEEDKVIVEGVNIVKKHQKSRQRDVAGEVIEKAMPVHVSNVSLIDPKTKKATKVGYEMKDGKKVRISKKSGQKI
jgi:large subunit ribosomal protein L24